MLSIWPLYFVILFNFKMLIIVDFGFGGKKVTYFASLRYL